MYFHTVDESWYSCFAIRASYLWTLATSLHAFLAHLCNAKDKWTRTYCKFQGPQYYLMGVSLIDKNLRNKKVSRTYWGSQPRTSAIPENDSRKGVPNSAARSARARWPTCKPSNLPSATTLPATSLPVTATPPPCYFAIQCLLNSTMLESLANFLQVCYPTQQRSELN